MIGPLSQLLKKKRKDVKDISIIKSYPSTGGDSSADVSNYQDKTEGQSDMPKNIRYYE